MLYLNFGPSDLLGHAVLGFTLCVRVCGSVYTALADRGAH